MADEFERADFWKKMTPKGELKKARKRAAEMNHEPAPRPKPVPPAYREALKASLPVPKIPLTFWYRTAGTGSLGRPRWVARGDWHGSPDRARGEGNRAIRVGAPRCKAAAVVCEDRSRRVSLQVTPGTA